MQRKLQPRLLTALVISQEVVQEAVERDSLADALRGVGMLQEDAEAGLLALDEGQCLSLLSFACLRCSKQLARSAWHILQASLKPRPTGKHHSSDCCLASAAFGRGR